MVGHAFAKGEGVKQSYHKAIYWYRRAARRANKYAQYNLGLCYLYGDGIKKNKAVAHRWLRLAARQGFKKALRVLKKNP